MQREIPRLKADFFKTLGHPLRIRVLELLSEEPQSVSALLGQVDAEQPTLSQQLGVLRRAGLVTAHRNGPRVIYAMADPRLADVLRLSREILLHQVTATRDELRAS